MTSQFELVKTVSSRLFVLLVCCVGFSIVIIEVCYHWNDPIPFFLVPLVFGFVGGLVSIQRRLKKISINDLRLLAESWSYAILPAFVGGLLAIILYILFYSEIIKSDLFPEFECYNPKGPLTGDFRDIIYIRAVDGDYQGYGKMMIWAFIAGFSENFVIDILGRFQKEGSSNSSEATAVDKTNS